MPISNWQSAIANWKLTEYLDHTFDRAREHVDLFSRVVEGKRRARGSRHVESLHDWLRAVMPGAHGDAFLVEDRADVVWMNVIDHKRKHARFVLCSADDAHAFDRRDALGRVTQQLGFVSRGTLASDTV